MADPQGVDDLAKVAGGGGLGALVASVAAFFARASTSARLDAIAAALGEMRGQMAVLLAASERRDAEWQRLDAEKRLAALEAHVEQLQRTIDQVVHS